MNTISHGTLDEKISAIFSVRAARCGGGGACAACVRALTPPLRQMYDTDGDGGINIVELLHLVRDGSAEFSDCVGFSEEIMKAHVCAPTHPHVHSCSLDRLLVCLFVVWCAARERGRETTPPPPPRPKPRAFAGNRR